MKPSEPATVSLRERKKAKTRQVIREHAMRLFAEQGYARTTVDQIAEAAEVSPSTFFRYFPTKEDVVLADDLDPLMVAALRAQPAELHPIEAMRRAVRQTLSDLPDEDWAAERNRQQLAMSVPELRAKLFDEYTRTIEVVAGPLAERAGRKPDDFEIRNLAGAIIGVSLAAVTAMADNPKADVMKLIDKGLAHLAAGLPL